ncbi:MAG: hypothetical protein GY797_13610, partial [Deltaproteobacteria bacterium]|nr:hypothetical protein [Deltaproteobacteria bacterium]
MKKITLMIIICLTLSVGCTSIKVKPFTAEPKIDTICVCNNPKVSVDFLQSLKAEFLNYGIILRTFKNTGFEDEYPKEIVEQCEYIMTYTAKYTWDLAVYCWYFELHLYQGEVEVANAVFELEGMGGFDMTKFNPTETKIRKLLKEFLVNYPYVIEPPKSSIADQKDS